MKELLGETTPASTQKKEKTTKTRAVVVASSSPRKRTRSAVKKSPRSKRTRGTTKKRKTSSQPKAPLTVALETSIKSSEDLLDRDESDSVKMSVPPVIVDMSRGADKRTGQAKRKPSKAPSTAARPPSTNKKRQKKEKNEVGQENLDLTSPVVERLRDAARQTLPSDASDRIVSSTSASCLSIDPLKEENKTTLASLTKGPGKSLLLSGGGGTSESVKPSKRRSRRKAGTSRRKKVQETEPTASFSLSEVQDLNLVVGTATSEAISVGGITESQANDPRNFGIPVPRELSRNQGVPKKAPLGVAVPAPVDRSSKLRRKLEQSSMSHPSLSRHVDLDTSDNLMLDSVLPDVGDAADPPASLSLATDWETKSPQELADEGDARRMNAPDYSKGHAPSGMVRDLEELKSAYSDANHLNMDDMRTAVSQYLDGLLSDKVLRFDLALRMRKGNDPLAAAAAITKTASEANGDTVTRASRRKGAGSVLVFNETEAEVLQALCCEPFMIGAPAPAISKTDTEEEVQAVVLRDRMEEWLRMPMDSLEVAVLMGSKPVDTMMYFMAYDDPTSLIKRIYESAMRIGGMAKSASLLCGPQSGHPQNTEKFRTDNALRIIEQALATTNALWVEARALPTTTTEDIDGTKTKLMLDLFTRKESLNIMKAVLTGDFDGQRHNMVRVAVAREEFLAGVFAEPAMRLFMNAAAANSAVSSEDDTNKMLNGNVEPSEWPVDQDVIQMMRSKLANFALQHQQQQQVGDADSESTSSSSSSSETGGPKTPWWKPMLPKLGRPATKAYNADFLREVDPTQSLERPCVNGARYCVSWWMASHGGWPASGSLNRANGAFVMREYYAPDVWDKIVREDSLPETGTHCRLCKLFRAKFHWVQLCMLTLQSRCVIPGYDQGSNNNVFLGALLGQDHCDAIEVDGGYTQDDMLPIGVPGDGSWTGFMDNVVGLCFGRYIPGKCKPPISLNQQRKETVTTNEKSKKVHIIDRPECSCFFEQTNTDFS